MFTFTKDERQVVLFLLSLSLVGLGANFIAKTNSPIKSIIAIDPNFTKINLNQVNLEDLLYTPGITPKLAEKIITYRDSHGPFQHLEELKEIRGIGDYRYEKIKDLFFVE
jgi:competence protein ComEA